MNVYSRGLHAWLLLTFSWYLPQSICWVPAAGRRRGRPGILTGNIRRSDATSSSVPQREEPPHGDDPSSTYEHDAPTSEEKDTTRRRMLASPILASAAAALFVSPPGASWALDEYENKRIAIFEKASPSVVFIDTFTERRDAFSTNILEVPLGSGSGFVWDTEGHIVTNYHVIRNAQTAQIAILTADSGSSKNKNKDIIQSPVVNNQDINKYTSMRPTSSLVKGGTRSVFKAEVVGVDPGKDIAVLKVDAPKEVLTPLKTGSSANLKVGQSVLAIGNPFGLDHSLSSGIISGLGREVKSPIGRPITNVVQIDAGELFHSFHCYS